MRELIENDGVESYSSESAKRSESEELQRNHCLEKRPRREDTDVDKKISKIKRATIDRVEIMRQQQSPIANLIAVYKAGST